MIGLNFAANWITRARDFARSRRLRMTGVIVAAVVLLYGLAGFFAVPPLLRHIITGPVAASLKRPASVGKIAFNPFSLRLNLDRLHIGDRESSRPFVDLGHLRIKLAWTSLWRLAPIVGEVVIDRPAIHLVRTGENRFNFSDLIEQPTPPPPARPAKPLRFAVSNIQIHDGAISLDDQLLGDKHAIEHLRLDLPFIANLPADVDVYVQPLLQMVVDGSPLRLAGKAKPFATPPESAINLNLHRLDLTRYLGYLPHSLPLKVAHGLLSCALEVRFVNTPAQPLIRIGGAIALEQADVRDGSNAPILALNRAVVRLTDVEPLHQIVRLQKIRLEGLTATLVRNADGSTNLTPLTAPTAASNLAPSPTPPPVNPAAAASPATIQPAPNLKAPAAPPASIAQAAPAIPAQAPPVTVAQATPASTPGTLPPASIAIEAPNASSPTAPAPSPFAPEISLDSFDLSDSAVKFTDLSGTAPAAVAIQGIHLGLKNLHTRAGAPPASFGLNANLAGGGTIAATGTLDVVKSQAAVDISLDQIDLPSLQNFAQLVLAATIARGKLTAHAGVQTRFGGGNFNLHAEPASVALDDFALQVPGEAEPPVRMGRLSAAIGDFDLAARHATVTEIRSEGMRLLVRRGRHGELSLAALIRTQPPPSAKAATHAAEVPAASPRPAHRASRRHPAARAPERPAAAAPTAIAAGAPAPAHDWQYLLKSLVVDKGEIRLDDELTARPVTLALAPLNLHVQDVSSDLAKPFALEFDGMVNGKGSFKLSGTTAIKPLRGNFKLATRRLDLGIVNPFVTSQLNATIANAFLTMNGAAGVATAHDQLQLNYRGDATLGNVRILDKLTNDLFLRWNALSLSGIDLNLGSGPPKARVGGIALSNFYARVILDSSGRLNLSDITTNPQAAPKSLTRAQTGPSAQPAATPAPQAPAPNALAVKPAPPIPASVEIGGITLQGGRVNYTDNFIKPNYTADLRDVGGEVGAFGTNSTAPAQVTLQGELNGSAPVNIDGSLNPLVPMAMVDLKAKANGVELTGLTPYSTKYTGYPIVKGTLTVDVHYLLNQNNLTAQNHIFIDQLTFGDKVENTTAINLPVRLAVSLLKDSRGQINLDLPISGSLSDPQFSVGSVIIHIFTNLIVKAATSPFSLLAAAFGSGGQDLNYVEFDPGRAALTPEAEQRLATLSKALRDRPGLRLNIAGRVDPEFDREGLREAMLEQRIKLQKMKDLQDEGESATVDSIKVAPDEYEKYLRRAYKAAKFAKPRNFVGLEKSLPPDEMKRLIITNTEVTDQDLAKLAGARANAVRQALGKSVDPARLFLVTAKLNADGIKDKGKTTRADLSLE